MMGRNNTTRLQFYALPESVCTQFLTISMECVPIIVLGLTMLNTGLNPAMNGQIGWNYTEMKKADA
jgi:hypothetical protein